MRSRHARAFNRTTLLIGVLALAACQAAPSAEPLPTVPVRHAYTLCPPGGELPAQEATDRALAVLTARLTLLGFDAPRITTNRCIEIEVPITADDAAVQAALLGNGRVEIVPVPANQLEAVVAGGPPPVGVQPLLVVEDIDSAVIGTSPSGAEPTLDITLTDAGSAALASWTQAHVGENMALVVDGVVVAVPTINEPITTGQISLDVAGEAPLIPLRAIAIMIESGPLPPEWAQPERPQG